MESIDKGLKAVKSDMVATDNYYKSELGKLKSGSVYTNLIQVTDSEGNKTKCLSLNVECIDEVVYYLQVLRGEIVKDK